MKSTYIPGLDSMLDISLDTIYTVWYFTVLKYSCVPVDSVYIVMTDSLIIILLIKMFWFMFKCMHFDNSNINNWQVVISIVQFTTTQFTLSQRLYWCNSQQTFFCICEFVLNPHCIKTIKHKDSMHCESKRVRQCLCSFVASKYLYAIDVIVV